MLTAPWPRAPTVTVEHHVPRFSGEHRIRDGDQAHGASCAFSAGFGCDMYIAVIDIRSACDLDATGGHCVKMGFILGQQHERSVNLGIAKAANSSFSCDHVSGLIGSRFWKQLPLAL